MSYKDYVKKVKGKKGADIMLFALSTCGWCAKTKALLDELGFEYGYVDVDLLNGKEQKEVELEFKKRKIDFGFPRIIINGKKVILGFEEAEIRDALK